MNHDLLQRLAEPFPPSAITWKPGSVTKDGTKALALAYADLRAYQNRLDEVCGLDWSVSYTPWGDRIVCHLTVCGCTRSSTGEADRTSAKNENAGTVAEAQAFKRACAMFGMGRYLYNLPMLWVDFDNQRKRIAQRAQERLAAQYAAWYAQETGTEQFGNGAQPADPFNGPSAGATANGRGRDALLQKFNALGLELYGGGWERVRDHNVQRISNGNVTTPNALTALQLRKLISGMEKLKQQREAEPVAA